MCLSDSTVANTGVEYKLGCSWLIMGYLVVLLCDSPYKLPLEGSRLQKVMIFALVLSLQCVLTAWATQGWSCQLDSAGVVPTMKGEFGDFQGVPGQRVIVLKWREFVDPPMFRVLCVFAALHTAVGVPRKWYSLLVQVLYWGYVLTFFLGLDEQCKDWKAQGQLSECPVMYTDADQWFMVPFEEYYSMGVAYLAGFFM